MNEETVLYGGAIGFLPTAERLRFYEERAQILKEWVAAGYGDPQKVQIAIRMTERRIELIKIVAGSGGKLKKGWWKRESKGDS